MSTEVRPAFGQMRVPDILETIADLSNDEVFTPPDLANKVLDMLPESIWTDSSVTFLDPATKTGVFLREITKRLIAGLEHEFPDLQERINHILTKQVYGLGITELTSLMSRRTVYCSTTANGIKSVCTEFDDIDGNIKFPDSKHSFNKHGKCTVCGAGEDLYYEEEGLDNYAYSFLHDNLKEVFGDVKFDVIIGNPPYQLETGDGTQSKPIYQKFVEKAISMNPQYIAMITPSRWMVGGLGLDDFRENMLEKSKLEILVDNENSLEIFPSVGVNGGICYFLWNKEHDGLTDYTYIEKDGEVQRSRRKLKEDFSDYVIRNEKHLSIIKKTHPSATKEKSFSNIVSGRDPFGLTTDFFNNEKNKDKIKEVQEEGFVKVHGMIDRERAVRFTDKKEVSRSIDSINKYKVFFPGAMGTDTTNLPKVIAEEEKSACTQTYLMIGPFNTLAERDNCLTYMRTKFFRALFYFNKYSFVFTKRTFSLIPLQDFSKPWTDKELYKKYKLTEEEIAYIEENIEEMK